MSERNSNIISMARDLGLAFSEHRLVDIQTSSDVENMRNDVRNVGNDMRAVLATL